MMPPITGVDLVRVMRREMAEEHRKAKHHLPFESAEDFENERSGDSVATLRKGGLLRLLTFAFVSPGRSKL